MADKHRLTVANGVHSPPKWQCCEHGLGMRAAEAPIPERPSLMRISAPPEELGAHLRC